MWYKSESTNFKMWRSRSIRDITCLTIQMLEQINTYFFVMLQMCCGFFLCSIIISNVNCYETLRNGKQNWTGKKCSKVVKQCPFCGLRREMSQEYHGDFTTSSEVLGKGWTAHVLPQCLSMRMPLYSKNFIKKKKEMHVNKINSN